MGLDSVELILAVEDSFQIHIADEEAGCIATVGELYSVVLAKLQGKDSKRCLTSAAFYRVRRGFVDGLGVDPREIKPSTPLDAILSRRGRREKWRRIRDAACVEIPDVSFFAAAFPNRAVTVGDLARDLLVANHARLATETSGWNKQEVWDMLRRLVAAQTGVDIERVKPEARLVDDLGID